MTTPEPLEVADGRQIDDEFEQVAIIGMAGRYPDAPDLDAFWRNLRDGRESIRAFTEAELADLGIPEDIYRAPGFVAMGTDLPDMDRFDAELFGFTPRQAEMTDPQARILLETSYAALEHAGYDPLTYDEPIGLFAGSNPTDYATLLGVADPTDPAGAFAQLIGTEKDFLATRIAHQLNLRGPALNVQTACSTSLVAVHVACQSLLTYQCTVALAGGVAVNLRQGAGYLYQQGMISSPDGHCRAFDAAANGTTLGQGCGVVVLKRLSEAVEDGDTIHAVIKATAINNDGAGKISYTAPSEDGQAEVIATALSLAGVSGDDISYVETHGTGTLLGDPVEIAALTRAFAADSGRTGYCGIGSVKTNIGHADAAAGVTGLIKTVLALEHREIPPSLNFERPNPNIDFASSPFYVNTQLRPWDSPVPRRAGVSAFGIGGTNAHAVLEEPPTPAPSDPASSAQLITLSARSPEALDEMSATLADYLDAHPGLNPADVAYTLQVGRADYEHRLAVVTEDAGISGEPLRGHGPFRVNTAGPVPESSDVVFMFSGQGAQYPGMARGLYETEPRFRSEVDRCARILEPLIGRDIRELLFPDPADEEAAAAALRQTACTQPALFTVEWALAQLYLAWGVRPSAVVGHSIGEYVAATLAGIFPIDDALRLVSRRGQLMQELPGGTMLAVPAPAADVEAWLTAGVEIAAVNSSHLTVVSGEDEAIAAFQAGLGRRNIDGQILHTSHAFHSAMMDPILDAFAAEVAAADPQPPQLPMLSNVTGTWLAPDQAQDPGFWASQIRRPVRFADNIAELLHRDQWVFLEVGPGRALATFVRQHSAVSAETTVITSIRHPKEDRSDMSVALEAVGRLWQAGITPQWEALHGSSRRHRIPLPGYAFQRQRYWGPAARHVLALGAGPDRPAGSASARRNALDDWFYLPSWKRAAPPEPIAAKNVLVFGAAADGLAGLVDAVESDGGAVTFVGPGPAFRATESNFEIDPNEDEDYRSLFAALGRDGRLPDVIVHAWTTRAVSIETVTDLRAAIDWGVNSTLAVARALGAEDATHTCRIEILTVGAHRVVGQEEVRPWAAALQGPAKVIPLEYPNLSCRHIDVETPSGDAPDPLLLDELRSAVREPIVALRGSHRWVYDVLPVHLPQPTPDQLPLKHHGVYLIAGGLGGVGLGLAAYLAEQYQAHVILTSRSGRPVLDPGRQDPELARRIAELERIEQLAAGVIVATADITDEAAMRAVRTEAEAAFGPIDGIIHAAGVVDTAGAIHRRSRQAAEHVIASKVYGTHVIDRVFPDPLDFVVLSSSMSTMLYHNRFGQVGYVTANSFVEAAPLAMENGTPVVAIAWDDWLEMGMSVRAAGSFSESYGYDHITIMDPLYSFTPEQGAAIFERALAAGHPQLYISTTDLETRIQEDVHVVSPFLQRALEEEDGSAADPASTPVEGLAAIREVWSDLLGIENIGVDDDFFELGGDSLQVARMADRLSRRFGVTVPLNLVFDAPTVSRLHERIGQLSGGMPEPDGGEHDPVTGPVALSPWQLRFLARGAPNPNHFNASVLVRPHDPLRPDLIELAVGEVVAHHDSLRLRVYRDGDQWAQTNEGQEGDHWTFSHVDLSSLEPEARSRALVAAADELHGSLDLAAGPIVRTALFDLAGEQRLFFTAHHFAADRISLLQILNDLQVAYRQLVDGSSVSLPSKKASFQEWSQAITDYTRSPSAAEDLAYWLSQPWDELGTIPRDRAGTPESNTNASADAVKVSIAAVPPGDGAARIDEVVLAALAGALADSAGSRRVLIETMGHGRRLFGSDIDISRTTGLFLTYAPLLLEAGQSVDLAAYVHQLRSEVERGWTFEALRWVGGDGPRLEELRGLPRADVLYNFVGRPITADPDSLLLPVHEDRGDDTTPTGLRDHPLALYVEQTDTGVDLTLVYSANLHDRSTVQALVDRIVAEVNRLLDEPGSGN